MNGQLVDHVARVARCVVHGCHFRTLLRRRIFAVSAQQLNGHVTWQQFGENFFFVGFIFHCCGQADRVAFVRAYCNGHQLDLRWRLRQHIFKLAEEQVRDVKFPGLKTRGQIFAPSLHIGKAQLAQITRFNAADDVATERPAQLIAALFPNGVEFYSLALGLQCLCLTAGETDDVGVERTGKALVAGRDNEQMQVILARACKQLWRLRANRNLGRDARHHCLKPLGIRARCFGRFGRPTQLRSGDHFHRLSDLLGRLDRVDPHFEGLQRRHLTSSLSSFPRRRESNS